MNQNIYNKLIDDLIKYSNTYYNENQSLISDREFDDLLKQAEQIEKDHPGWTRADSPTQNIGISTMGEKVKHNRKMLSLQNTYNRQEILEWFNKMKTDHNLENVIIEPKYDGVSFAARYEKGKLILGLTRGDGEYGEDITQNLRELNDLTINSDFSGEVRGEIIMEKDEFERLNVDNRYANPRNLTSGTLKLLDTEKFKQRKLRAFSYWLEDSQFKTHEESLKYLSKTGFNTGDYYLASDFDELWNLLNMIEQKKKSLNYEIDGAVIKVNQIDLWENIGGTSKFPHWAKAYKYEPDTAITTVKDIEFWVGRSGKITPVAILDPVFLAGTTVQKATLNNKAYMEKLDIQIGDRVNIKKAAEIIPFINHVIKDLRESDGQTRTIVEFPKNCPDCDTKLVKLNEDHQDYYCPNELCTSRIIGAIVNYTTAMEIDGFAEIIVEKLYNAGFLRSISDLYELKNHRDEMVKLERMGEKLVDKLFLNIKNSKTQKLEKFISAIGIRNVGLSTAKELVKNFKTLENIQNAKHSDLIQLDDIADIVAKNIIDYFQKNKEFIERMKIQLKLTENEDKEEVGDMLEGKSFCITGSLSTVRKEYEELIEQQGGKNVSGVTSKTDYLVTNDQVTETKKLLKARELGTNIISEDELAEMLGL